MGSIARQAMEFVEGNRPFAIRSPEPHDRFERGEGDTEIARMCRDAVFALAEDRVNPIVALNGRAAASWDAFIAHRKSRIVKIITARPLHEIASGGGKIAQLRAGPGKQRFADHRIARGD